MPKKKDPEFEISCQNGPEGMVTEAPTVVSTLATVECTGYGQILTGSEGVPWNYPGGFAPVIIPAQTGRAQPEKVNNESHFTSVTAKKLTQKEAAEVYKGLSQGFYKIPKEAPETIEIIATNQMGLLKRCICFNWSQKQYGALHVGRRASPKWHVW